MKCPVCGCSTWQAHQVQHFEVLVDEDNTWIENNLCYYSAEPFGPYECTNCQHVEDEIKEENRI